MSVKLCAVVAQSTAAAIRKLRRRFDLFIVCSETFRIGIISEEAVTEKPAATERVYEAGIGVKENFG
jgi:hypothetical protein